MNSLKVYPGQLPGSVEYFHKRYPLVEASTVLHEGYTTFLCSILTCSFRLRVRNAPHQPGKFFSAPQAGMNNNHHDHDVDVMRYTVALYRAKMYFLAQQYPEESYDNLHWNVLEEIRATDEQIEQIGTFDPSLQDALDSCRQDAQLRGYAVPWCDRCTATTDKGCNQEVVIDLADSADEGSDTSKQDIEDGSAIIEGPESEAKMKDVASVEGADPPGNVEEINNVTPERQ